MSRGDLKTLGWMVVAIGVVTLVVAWFLFSPGRAAARAHDAGLERWAEHEPAAYSFDYSYCSGMCSDCSIHVTVHDGVVTDAAGSRNCGPVDDGPTIEYVFGVAEEHALSMFGDIVTIRYDRYWGFPSSIETLCRDHSADCGSGWSVANFEDLSEIG